MSDPSIVQPAAPADRGDALRLLFSRHAEADRERRVASAQHLLATGELDPRGLFVEYANDAERSRAVVGVLVCQLVPGASALFWPPSVLPDTNALAREDRLLIAGLAWVRGQGAKLAQALLTDEEVLLAASLTRNGFRHIARLWYLVHDLDLSLDELSAESPFAFEPYPSVSQEIFQNTLNQTYDGTLDCPEVNYVRTIAEVIAGHQAQGRFVPEHWWLVLDNGQPAGVLIIADMPAEGTWDLAYLGVVPSHRRRGLGRAMVRKALFEAKAAGTGRLTLAVDGRNEPALQLYRQLRFAPFDRREVYLAFLQHPAHSV